MGERNTFDTFDDFRAGDRVRHLTRGEAGDVTAIENGCVVVLFDECGGPLLAKFDRRWFELHPGLLTKIPVPAPSHGMDG